MVVLVFRSESPVHSPAPPPESPEPEPEPQKVRPRLARRRPTQKTVIEVDRVRPKEEVSVDEGTQTMENGNQTDSQLLRQYNHVSRSTLSTHYEYNRYTMRKRESYQLLLQISYVRTLTQSN